MVRLITLRGRLNGSAMLEANGGSTGFTLKLRDPAAMASLRGNAGITAHLIAPGSIASCALTDGAGSAKITGVRGIVLTDSSGRTVSEGFGGMSETAFERAKVLIRLRSDQNAPRADVGGGGGERTVKRTEHETEQLGTAADAQAPAASNITRRILSQAKELFGGSMSEAPTDAAEEKDAPPLSDSAFITSDEGIPIASTDDFAVNNPFPRLFPNSTWRGAKGESTLHGRVGQRGKTYAVTAVPVRRGQRFPPAELIGTLSRTRGTDGRLYWLSIKRM